MIDRIKGLRKTSISTEKLKATRVELVEWEAKDKENLVLLFKIVPPYTYKTENTKLEPTTTFFTDFGYIKLKLVGKKIGFNDENNWLNEYINNDKVFLEEEVEKELIFWEGEDEDRYDWVSSYSISFDSKHVEYLDISNDEWRSKYLEMALNWKKEADFNLKKHEEWYSLFFMLYRRVVKDKIKRILPNPIPVKLLDFYESSLTDHLDLWLKDVENAREAQYNKEKVE